ncbi:MAG: chorismate-binding protein [Ignavibacteriales bacterium]|nr:chorismate-binding protein [Ignavibacteriales bacterium]
MKIHRFSHVMHIVSRVEGKLRDDLDCIDALKSCFLPEQLPVPQNKSNGIDL